jgi:hypothetical protein
LSSDIVKNSMKAGLRPSDVKKLSMNRYERKRNWIKMPGNEAVAWHFQVSERL